MLCFAVETSCDETSVALVAHKDGVPHIVGQIVSSQIEQHKPYGGVVPEIATRQHLAHLEPLTQELLTQTATSNQMIGSIAATQGPGLASSLMIGYSYARALATAWNLPFLGINHLEGHIFSPFLTAQCFPIYPHIALIVSGGHTLLIHACAPHTYELLGTTRDDAAGEAFDKGAKLLGLPYPGGPEIEKAARSGNPSTYEFPRAMLHSGDYQFSFSGLKTSLRVRLAKEPATPATLPHLCASYQQAIVDVLVAKAIRACRELSCLHLALSGGVSCNGTFRSHLQVACSHAGIHLHTASPNLCTDNAAMIAAVALSRTIHKISSQPEPDILPQFPLAKPRASTH